MNIQLALISHTNVGKTALARTLLQRDIGQSLDQAHVTDTSDVHELVATPNGDALLLWDTPGLGDSARLLKRLSRSADPMGWLMTQVWDRWIDRPLYSSQMALRTVREQCDVLLYLVNAAEGPSSAGYVALEMQILGWMDKPVLVLLNQTGPPREGDGDQRDLDAWRAHLAGFPWVKGLLSLDAFTRVWIQEDLLLQQVGECLAPAQRAVLESLRAEWRRRNLEVFDGSMTALAQQLSLHALDSEVIAARGWAHGLRDWLLSIPKRREPGAPPPGVASAMEVLGRRADDAVRACMETLIPLHGLSGAAAEQIQARVSAQFTRNESVDPAKAGLLGAVLSGALGGLAADLAAGGLTIGAGALVGGVLGLLGATGAARAYNFARGGDEDRVRWSPDFLQQRVESAVLRYLAVAHFGRGRGAWLASEYPPHWPGVVHTAANSYRERLQNVWLEAAAPDATDGASQAARIAGTLSPILHDLTMDVLTTLYPHAYAVFDEPAPTTTAIPGR